MFSAKLRQVIGGDCLRQVISVPLGELFQEYERARSLGSTQNSPRKATDEVPSALCLRVSRVAIATETERRSRRSSRVPVASMGTTADWNQVFGKAAPPRGDVHVGTLYARFVQPTTAAVATAPAIGRPLGTARRTPKTRLPIRRSSETQERAGVVPVVRRRPTRKSVSIGRPVGNGSRVR